MSPPSPRLYALVPCAGVGERAGTALPKQDAEVAGRPMVAHALAALAGVARLAATLVVIAPGDRWSEHSLPQFGGARQWLARCGGATRAASVAGGLDELLARGASPRDWVLVHDAARCLLRAEWVERLIDACLGDEVGGMWLGLVRKHCADKRQRLRHPGPPDRHKQVPCRADRSI